MRELMTDFITSLDGHASGEGWPGWWGLKGPKYLAWLGEQPPVTYLMGANTYRLMFGFSGGETPAGTVELPPAEEASVDQLTRAPKILRPPLLKAQAAFHRSTCWKLRLTNQFLLSNCDFLAHFDTADLLVDSSIYCIVRSGPARPATFMLVA